ncbi:TPA: PagK family vesicle-borne virulence factor, partial [Salmonella enterica subsp. enterica serovar Kentucky]
TGDIMRHRVFFPLLLVLSATAFSASAMAASDSKPPPDNTKHASRGWPSGPEAFIHPEWCEHWPAGEMKPPGWCQVCGC